MGAKKTGAGTSTIKSEGEEYLHNEMVWTICKIWKVQGIGIEQIIFLAVCI